MAVGRLNEFSTALRRSKGSQTSGHPKVLKRTRLLTTSIAIPSVDLTAGILSIRDIP
jgi:hypothetical protein